jgi:TRAP-type C4-dicarboxylate transport system permease small subunit
MLACEKKILKIFKVFVLFGGGLLLLMMIITTAHVFGRYGFNSPIYGQAEIVCLMQVVIISLAGAYTLLKGRHVSMGLLIDRLSGRTQTIINAIMYLFCFLFSGIAAWQTVGHANYILEAGKHTERLRIPSAPFFYVVAFGWALISIGCIVIMIRSFYFKETKH